MQCQILYYSSNSKTLQSKGFSDVEEANKWLNSQGAADSEYTQNARIVVDYAAVEAYKEMYDLMKERLFGNKEKTTERKMI